MRENCKAAALYTNIKTYFGYPLFQIQILTPWRTNLSLIRIRMRIRFIARYVYTHTRNMLWCVVVRIRIRRPLFVTHSATFTIVKAKSQRQLNIAQEARYKTPQYAKYTSRTDKRLAIQQPGESIKGGRINCTALR